MTSIALLILTVRSQVEASCSNIYAKKYFLSWIFVSFILNARVTILKLQSNDRNWNI